jgi:hypothetical protein
MISAGGGVGGEKMHALPRQPPVVGDHLAVGLAGGGALPVVMMAWWGWTGEKKRQFFLLDI